jgi:hypothetical protein
VRAANGRQPTNAVWDALNRRRRPDPAACPFCDVDNESMTLQDALAIIDNGRTVGATFEIRACAQVPARVHVVFPPDDETEPRR